MVINGAKSDFINVESGVPQGSVLGPCLFLVYINVLPNRLTSSARLFADDTAVYSMVSSTEDQTRLQQDLNRLSEWGESWDRAFHPDKCTTLAVTRSRRVHRHQYRLHGRDLELETSARYLGVIVNGDVTWDEHIDSMCAKANGTLGFLKRNIKISSQKIKEVAYNTYVRPILEYASSVWDPHTQKNIDGIEAIQLPASRRIDIAILPVSLKC